MLKHLLLSGWFRVQPFYKYIVVVILLAPLVAASSSHSTSAKQSQLAKNITSGTRVTNSVSQQTADNSESDIAEVLKTSQIDSLPEKLDSLPRVIATIPEEELLQIEEVEPWTIKDYYLNQEIPQNDLLAAVELAPSVTDWNSVSDEDLASQQDLVQRLKAAKLQNQRMNHQQQTQKPLEVATIAPSPRESQLESTVIIDVEQPDEAELTQQDPVGSPYPIPWKWIQATQEVVGSQAGSGMRYYRSVPVISPDGRYAVYSRVALEVKPEMYNSRVTSVLFIEDRQTKRLRVLTSTSPVKDPLLDGHLSKADTLGSIEVLVPVSWSEKGERFLARKFEGAMNTSDVTDHAVIWDRHKNHSHSVTPSQEEHKHQIAVLLGWSKTQPEQVLFHAGELGDEQWSMLAVSTDGKTIAATNVDQPVTYGKTVKDVWAGPQFAYR